MTHNLIPSFLSSLVPQPVQAASSYNLRNSNDIQNIPARSNYYHNSFLPSTVRKWNSLPLDTRNSDSINSFKQKLNLGVSCAPKYYFTGNRNLQILHTRLGAKCSALNHDLFLKTINDSPLCTSYKFSDEICSIQICMSKFVTVIICVIDFYVQERN